MKFAQIFVALLLLLQANFAFSFWGEVLKIVSGPILQLGQDYLEGLINPPPSTSSNAPSEIQIAMVKQLEKLNKGIDTMIDTIVDFKDELISFLEQAALDKLFTDISALWNKCRDILLTNEAGRYKSEEEFQRKYQKFLQKDMDGIFRIVEEIRFEKAERYLDRVRTQLIESGADFITYHVKLTLAIKDFVLHISRVLCLLNIAVSSEPEYQNSIIRLSDDLPLFDKYHQQYVLGSWFNLTEQVLSEGGEIYFRDKILEMFGSRSHIYWHQGYGFGQNNAGITSFRAIPATGADIGNFALFVEFLIDGAWKRLCASGEPLSVKIDCEGEESQKWKPTPCSSSLKANEASLNFLCLRHVATGLTLTYVPSTENAGSLALQDFDQNNPNQLFNFTEARRCCEIYSNHSFTGSSTKVCLALDQGYQEALVLAGGMESFASVICEVHVQLVAFEGKNFSKRAYTVETGTQRSFDDPNQATTMQSFYVESLCSRIFTEENFAGDFRSICSGDLSNLQEEFAGKNISVFIRKPLELFDAPDFTGNSIILRTSMINLKDWPFVVRSIRIIQ